MTKTSQYLVLGAVLMTVFAAYFGHSRLYGKKEHTDGQHSSDLAVHRNHAGSKAVHRNHGGSRPESNSTRKKVFFIGTSDGNFPFTQALGKMIAEKGYDLITGSLTSKAEDNSGVIRKSFKATNPEGTSYYSPVQKVFEKTQEKMAGGVEKWDVEKDKIFKENNIDEMIPPDGDKLVWISQVDYVIAAPGGDFSVQQVAEVAAAKKKCFGILTPNTDILIRKIKGTEVKEQSNLKVLQALVKNKFGGTFYDKEAPDNSLKKIGEFLDDQEPENEITPEMAAEAPTAEPKSGSSKICHSAVFGILLLGLLTVYQ